MSLKGWLVMSNNCLYDYTESKVINELENKKRVEEIRKIYTPCNYDKWILKKLWTVEEASLIYIGIEPDVFISISKYYEFKKIHNLMIYSDFHIREEICLIYCKQQKVYDELKIEVLSGNIDVIYQSNVPYINNIDFCKWAKNNGRIWPDVIEDFLDVNKHIHKNNAGSKKDTTRIRHTEAAFKKMDLEQLKNDRGKMHRQRFLAELRRLAGEGFHSGKAGELWRNEIPASQKAKGRPLS